MSAASTPAANTKASNTPAGNAKPSFFSGLFGRKKNASVNVGARSEGNTSNNAAIAAALQKEEMNKAKRNPFSFLPSFLGGKTQAQKNAEAAAASVANGATGVNTKKAVAALNASLNGNAAKRARTRKQRGGYRGKTMRLPGPRNVLRVTGKTVRKLRNVGVYGLKKVGNGVHMVTGLLGSIVRKGGKTLKSLGKRRQQTRRRR
jgi:hypothetical protein